MTAYLTHARTTLLLAAALLLLALAPTAPAGAETCGDSAHPSGKDRCVEEGGSGTQGSATSDPDDDGNGPDRSNGGVDQDGGEGGVNQQDQDGNNGCGNDQDFEDDNEGLCDGQAEASNPNPVGGEDKDTDKGGPDKGGPDVKETDGREVEDEDGSGTIRPSRPEGPAAVGNGPVHAEDKGPLGTVVDGTPPGDGTTTGDAPDLDTPADSASYTLAATGIGGLALVLFALASMGVGALALRRSRGGR